MQALTERLEVRLDEETIQGIDSWRAKQDDVPSRSEAVRRLVDVGLGAGGRDLRFSQAELLIVHMLCDLMRAPKDRELDADFISSALVGGHFWGLQWQHTGIFHTAEDSKHHVREIVDWLDMWSFIEEGVEKLSAADKKRFVSESTYSIEGAKFPGFDGNNETEHIGIARFMIEKLGRFTRFKARELNSHSPVLEMYGRMYSVFEPIRKTLVGRSLTADELVEIFKSRIHPSRRK
jgi:uncharacterized protein YfbU (UPF0304 family)/Arc/MetJ-type ribon-helix-helix transcriptional regulator